MADVTQLPSFTTIDLPALGQQLHTLLEKNCTALTNLLQKTSDYNWNNLLQPMEDMSAAVEKAWTPISHLHSVADTEQLREIYNTAISELSDYHMAVMQNAALYQAVAAIKAGPEFSQLEVAQQAIINHLLRDFKLAGVDLPAAEKKQFATLNQKLAKLTTQFQENVLDSTQSWQKHITDKKLLSGLPEHALASAKQAAERQQLSGWLFSLDMPDYQALITYADDNELRREIYFAFSTRASDQGPHDKKWDNSQTMQEILHTRHAMAQLLGFAHYAKYSLATKMAKTPSRVMTFLEELAQAALPQAKQEFADLVDFAKTHYQVDTLHAWDIAYYSEKLRQYAYAVSKEGFRPYFPAEHVINGLFAILTRLYGMQFTCMGSADVWHADVMLFSVSDADKKLRGYLYLDLYARQGKRDGAWMTDAYARRKLANGDRELPIGFVTCNFNAPVGNDPALLTHDDVNTLFHECGHAVQHLFTVIDYASVAGINGIPWDAVEIASQFMENWCWEKPAIDMIAQHYQTKELLPTELFEKLIRAKNFQSAMQTMRQLQFALFDFRLHCEYDTKQTDQIQVILDQVREKYAVFPTPTWNRFAHGFSHIFAGGYAAGYYSYKWAEVLASDAFSLFKENGIFDQKTGAAFLYTLLGQGGAQEPMTLFIQFRGREPSIDALLRHTGIIATKQTNKKVSTNPVSC